MSEKPGRKLLKSPSRYVSIRKNDELSNQSGVTSVDEAATAASLDMSPEIMHDPSADTQNVMPIRVASDIVNHFIDL
jgi:hypothetical protein